MRLKKLYIVIVLLFAMTSSVVAQEYNYVVPDRSKSAETTSKVSTGGGRDFHKELENASGKSSLATADNPAASTTKSKKTATKNTTSRRSLAQKKVTTGSKEADVRDNDYETSTDEDEASSGQSEGRIYDYEKSLDEDETADPSQDGNVRTDGFGLENEYSVNGWGFFRYGWRYFWTIAEEYSWQVRTCYTIIVLCIFCLFALFVMFMIRVRIRTQYKKRFEKIKNKFEEKFREVLINPEPMTWEEIEDVCECKSDDFIKFNVNHIQRLIVLLREELQEVIFIPNLENLCKVTGVRGKIEFNLVHHNDEFNSLQCVTILQLPISEGVLANYVNHRDLDVRNLARMCYILATEVEPYRYLLAFARDTVKDNDWAPWYPMALHQLFGWIMSKDRLMPNFVTLIEQAESEKVRAFFIQEISYWGTPEEQSYLHNYFNDDSHVIRSAAFQATAMLCDSKQEEELVNSFYTQPQDLRREILTAVYSIRSGNQTEFFKEVCKNSPSKETRELALTYLYDYSPESRLEFEALRNEHLDTSEDRNIFDQIESSKLLSELRNL